MPFKRGINKHVQNSQLFICFSLHDNKGQVLNRRTTKFEHKLNSINVGIWTHPLNQLVQWVHCRQIIVDSPLASTLVTLLHGLSEGQGNAIDPHVDLVQIQQFPQTEGSGIQLHVGADGQQN